MTQSAPLRILIIDDEPMVAKSLSRVLKAHSLRIVDNVDDALATLHHEAADLIFCDMMMPQKTGIDFYNAIVQTFPQLHNVIIFMTGGVFTPETHAFIDSVPNDVVQKPFDIYEIRLLVKQYCT